MSYTNQQNLAQQIKADNQVLDKTIFSHLCKSLKTSSHSQELLDAILTLDSSVLNRLTEYNTSLSELILQRNSSLKYTPNQLFGIFSKSDLSATNFVNGKPLILTIVRYHKEKEIKLSSEQVFSLISQIDNLNAIFNKQSLAMLLLKEPNLDLNKKQMISFLEKCDFINPILFGFSGMANSLSKFNPQFKEPLSFDEVCDLLIKTKQEKAMPHFLLLSCSHTPQQAEKIIENNSMLFYHYNVSNLLERIINKDPSALFKVDIKKIQIAIEKVTLEHSVAVNRTNKIKVL